MSLYDLTDKKFIYGPVTAEQLEEIPVPFSVLKLSQHFYICTDDEITEIPHLLLTRPVTSFDLQKEVEQALTDLNTQYEELVYNLIKDTPPSERESWYKQEREAEAYSANNNAATPYVDELAINRNVPRGFLLERILLKVQAYTVAHGTLTGKRQAIEDILLALPEETTAEEFNALNLSIT